MFINDSEWVDLQRDCSIFPAYTDYLYGLDTRPHVRNEPGLHPLLFATTPTFAHAPSSAPGGRQPYTNISPAHHQSHVAEQSTPFLKGSGIVKQVNGPIQALPQDTPCDVRQLRSSFQPAMGTSASTSCVPSLQDMERRRMLNTVQHFPASKSSSPTASQQFLREFRQRDWSSQHGGHADQSTSPKELSVSKLDHDEPPAGFVPQPSFQRTYTGQLHHTCTIRLLQPNDLTTDPQYFFIPAKPRNEMNAALTKLWDDINSHSNPDYRTECLTRIHDFSASIWKEQVKLATQEDQMQQQLPQQQSQQPQPQIPYQHSPLPLPNQTTFASATSYGLTESTKLHVHASLPKLLRCLDITQSPVTTQMQKEVAHEWVTAFKATLSPDAQQFVQVMLERVYMARHIEQGGGGDLGKGGLVGKVE